MKKINKIIIIVSAVMLVSVVVLYFLNNRRQTATQSKDQLPSSPASQNNNLANDNSAAQSNEASANTAPAASNAFVIALEDNHKNTALPGKQTDDSLILEKYGKFAFDTLANNPKIAEMLRNLDNAFDPSMLEVASPSHTYQLNNKKTYLAFSGCEKANCGGTEKIILFNEAENKVLMAAENDTQTQLNLFGNPDDQEKDLLVYIYFHQ